jgi:hypothetical protein
MGLIGAYLVAFAFLGAARLWHDRSIEHATAARKRGPAAIRRNEAGDVPPGLKVMRYWGAAFLLALAIYTFAGATYSLVHG